MAKMHLEKRQDTYCCFFQQVYIKKGANILLYSQWHLNWSMCFADRIICLKKGVSDIIAGN